MAVFRSVAVLKFYTIVVAILATNGLLLGFRAFDYLCRRFEAYRISMKESM